MKRKLTIIGICFVSVAALTVVYIAGCIKGLIQPNECNRLATGFLKEFC